MLNYILAFSIGYLLSSIIMYIYMTKERKQVKYKIYEIENILDKIMKDYSSKNKEI